MKGHATSHALFVCTAGCLGLRWRLARSELMRAPLREDATRDGVNSKHCANLQFLTMTYLR